MAQGNRKGGRLMGWKLEHDGQTLTAENITIGEATTVQQIVGRAGWETCDPGTAPDVLGAWCVVAQMRSGKTLPEAMLVINQSNLKALAAGYGVVPDASDALQNGETNPAAMQDLIDRLGTSKG